MKLFFSYPHDANAVLVERIKSDLETRGHEVWFDQAQIKEGDDWRARITRAILDSQQVVAFLSKHAVQDPGVCLNEIAIALADKGEAMVTVLVEPESEVNAPISITHIQWLRMEEWQRLQDAPGWYQAQLDKLVAAIESPGHQGRHDELEALRQALNPLSFNADIAPHVPRFTGRRWLIARYEDWLANQLASRVMRIEGGPGLGKTAISAYLAHATKSSVLAVHLCKYNMGDSRDPRRMVQTLAYQLATRLPDYRARLRKSPLLQPQAMDGKDAATLWSGLLVEPLHGLISRQRMAIIIDGLDEATESAMGSYGNSVVELLASELRKLPPWIGMVLTGRPDPEIARLLSAYKPVAISGDDPQNKEDLRSYIDGWLGAEVAAGRLAAHQQAAATCGLLDKSEGAFLYATQARLAAEQGDLDLTRPDAFPVGLTGIYAVFFQRRFPDAGLEASDYQTGVRPLLALLLASPEPLPLPLARGLLQWDEEAGDERKAVQLLGSFVEKRRSDDGESTLKLFHNSVREWLRDPDSAGDHHVQTRKALVRLAGAAWRRYLDSAKKDSYAGSVLPVLLPELSDQERITVLGGPSLNTSSTLMQLADTQIASGKYALSEGLLKLHVNLSESLAAADPENLALSRSLALGCQDLGEILGILGQHKESLSRYRSGLKIREALCAKHTGDTNLMRELSVALERMGTNLFWSRTADALGYFQRALKIRESLVALAPGDSKLCLDLAVANHWVGNALDVSGRPNDALAFYRAQLALAESLAAREPDELRIARNLLMGYGAMAIALRKLGRVEEALELLTRARKISDQIVTRAPSSQSMRDRATTMAQIGNVSIILQRPDAALVAFQECLNDREQVMEFDPENVELQREVYTGFERMADALQLLGRDEEAMQYRRRQMLAAESLAERISGSTEIWHDAFVSRCAWGDLLLTSNRIDEAFACYHGGLGKCEALLAQAPDESLTGRDLAMLCEKLGEACRRAKRIDDSLSYHDRSLKLRESHSAAAPENLEFAANLVRSLRKAGVALGDLRRHDEALAHFQRALDSAAAISAAKPEDKGSLRAQSPIRLQLGDAYAALGKSGDAFDCYLSCLSDCESDAAHSPENGQFAGELATLLTKLGNASRALGRNEAAAGYLQRALPLRKAIAERGAFADFVYETCAGNSTLGDTLKELGRTEEAIRAYQQAVTLGEGVMAGTTSFSLQFALDHLYRTVRLGDVFKTLGRSGEAVDSYLRGLKIGDVVAKAAAKFGIPQYDLAISYTCRALGDTLAKLGQDERAREYYERASKMDEMLAARTPATGQGISAKATTPAANAPADLFQGAAAAYDRGDYAAAMRLFQALADAGSAAAEYNVGAMYANGQGVPQDHVKAAGWYRRAADHGNAAAQNYVGLMYTSGQGVQQDDGEAAKWFRKAADQGVVGAQFNLANLYDGGKGVGQDYAEAARWYRKAADQGNAHAQHNMGFMYANGQGVPQDYAEAVKWYRKAADQGHPHAQNNLGSIYDEGKGVPQDYAEARKWFLKAADQGHARAMTQMGFMSAMGQGGPHDHVEAYKWFSLAVSRLQITTTRDQTAKNRDLTAAKLTPAQLTEAQRLAAQWKPR